MAELNRGEARATLINIARLAAPRGFDVDPNPLTISHGDDVYAVAMTARSSTTDSNQIPITKSAVEKAVEGSAESKAPALMFAWAQGDGSIGMVALTLAQHEELSAAKRKFTTTRRENGETYYYAERAQPGSNQMLDYVEMDREKKILFYISMENQRWQAAR